jgi:chromosome segregation ATPase
MLFRTSPSAIASRQWPRHSKELMMAGRKKGPPIPPHDAHEGERAFAVVVEQLRGEFKVFGEALGGLRQQMTDGFERVDREIGEVKRDLVEVKRDLVEVKRDLVEVKRDLVEVKSDLVEVKRDLVEVKRDLVEVKRDLVEVKRDLVEVNRDLVEVKRDLGEVKVDLGLVKAAVTTHTRELREIRGALGNKVERGEVEAIVEHAVAQIAQR